MEIRIKIIKKIWKTLIYKGKQKIWKNFSKIYKLNIQIRYERIK